MIANRDINRLSAGHSFQNRLFSCHPYLIWEFPRINKMFSFKLTWSKGALIWLV
jgi:hypothetical protein